MSKYRSRKLGRTEPLIKLHRRFQPFWIRAFTLGVTFGWFFYGIYIRIEPGISESTHFKRYVEREFPELNVFGPKAEDSEHYQTSEEYRSEQLMDFYRDKTQARREQ